MNQRMQLTPGSWPARIAKNPVDPTTVARKAACMTENYQVDEWCCNVRIIFSISFAQSIFNFFLEWPSMGNHSLSQVSNNTILLPFHYTYYIWHLRNSIYYFDYLYIELCTSNQSMWLIDSNKIPLTIFFLTFATIYKISLNDQKCQ